MNYVHVRERLEAYAVRFRHAATPAGSSSEGSLPARPTPVGTDALHSLGVGRR